MELQGKKCSCFPHVIKLIRVQGYLPGSGCKQGAAASLAQICLQPVCLCLHETHCCCCCCCMGLLIPLPPPSQCYRTGRAQSSTQDYWSLGDSGENSRFAQRPWQVFAQLFVLHLKNTVKETAQTRQCHWHLRHTVLLAPGSM